MSVTQAIETRILDPDALARTLRRLAHEIVERHADIDSVVIAGIRTGGVPVAAALARAVDAITHGERVGLAAIDVAGYRDDAPRAMARLRGTWASLSRSTDVAAPSTAPPIDSAIVILVDDVIQTGRTLRAALDAVSAHGRAAVLESAVLIDRGSREVPVRPTYVGKNIPTAGDEWVEVRCDDPQTATGAFLVRRS